MNREEAIAQLKSSLPQAAIEQLTIFDEVTLQLDKGHLKAALEWLKQQAGYETLMDLTAVDYLSPDGPYTKVVYLLHNPASYARLRLAVYVRREEALPAVIDLWEGADWYERELFDLFGVRFDGRPQPERILMPDDWQGHPLRRDYALTEESVEFKHGVKPKVPSEIIPYVKNGK